MCVCVCTYIYTYEHIHTLHLLHTFQRDDAAAIAIKPLKQRGQLADFRMIHVRREQEGGRSPAHILKRQCPGIFTISSRHMLTFENVLFRFPASSNLRSRVAALRYA